MIRRLDIDAKADGNVCLILHHFACFCKGFLDFCIPPVYNGNIVSVRKEAVMIHEKIKLFPDNDRVVLTTYLANDHEHYSSHVRPGMLVFPGGGYSNTSCREAEPIALAYVAAGFQVFVLDYSVTNSTSKPNIFRPLMEASMAMAYIRTHAEAWHVDPDKIAIVGFSAGGHAAASLGTLWHEDYITSRLCIPAGSNKPNAMILGYPVITSGNKAHRGSFKNLLGEKQDDPELLAYFSLEKQVSSLTPPTFLWHTAADTAVPVENSLLFATALAANQIPFEMHIYPEGRHGLSLCTPQVLNPQECP